MLETPRTGNSKAVILPKPSRVVPRSVSRSTRCQRCRIQRTSNGPLPSYSTVSAGSAVGRLVTSEVTDQIFSALDYGLEQSLRIQSVNLAFGPNGAPLVELRKQWGHNLYASYRQSFSNPPQQFYGVDYIVHSGIHIDFEQEQNPFGFVGQEGLEPIWKTILQASAQFNLSPVHKLPKKLPTRKGPQLQPGSRTVRSHTHA